MRRALLLFALILAAAPARAEAPARIPDLKPVMTTYNVYVGGIRFVTANILFQESRKKYRTFVQGSTYGLWYRLAPWHTTLEAEGSIKRDHFVPSAFHTRDLWGKKPHATDMRFTGNGNIKTEFQPPRNDDGQQAVSDDLKRGALDPVTALLQMLAHVATEEDCDIKVPVYDGKRRFDLDGIDKGVEQIDEEDYGVYKGPARVCDVNFTMIAGDWQDHKKNLFWKNDKGENIREPFHISLASPAPGVPELPVRLESGSPWGDIVIHLAEWHYATPSELKAKTAESATELAKATDQ